MPGERNVSKRQKVLEAFQRDNCDKQSSLRTTLMPAHFSSEEAIYDPKAYEADSESEERDSEDGEESERAEVKLSIGLVLHMWIVYICNTVHR